MRKFDDEPRDYTKKHSKRSPNRVGEGMRIINKQYEDQDLFDIDFEQDLSYNKTIRRNQNAKSN